MKSFPILAVFFVGALAAVAQTPTPITAPLPSLPSVIPTPHGTTTLLLRAKVVDGIIPQDAGSRVRVPPYDSVTLVAPEGWPSSIQWTKDGKPIAGATGPTLTIALATAADSGDYNVLGAAWPYITCGVLLEVAPLGHLSVLSARVELAPGTAPQIVGFVIGGKAQKNLLIRAVGPSLAPFGIARPAALPRLRYYDSAGQEFVSTSTGFPPDWGAIFASAGAFPLTGGERAGNAYSTGLFAPGAYTVHVSDDAHQGGTALVEVYELP
jgi:hypothetical protein